MKKALSLVSLFVASPLFAEENRQLDAHEHGVGVLNIAIVGSTVAMEFHAPGADIVGFEYEATRDEDLSAIAEAVEVLGSPLDLFVMPQEAACTVQTAQAELEGEDEHDEHADHDKHEDHEEHEDHADHDKHEDHEEHADHDDEAGHTEFHAQYSLTCDNPDAHTEISFAYFDVFSNAKEVEVQIITEAGARAFEVERGAPVLNLDR